MSGRGLIDTGASTSLITRRFADALSLPLHGKHPLVTARGTDMVNRYAFRLGFPLPDIWSVDRPYILGDELIGSEFVDHASFDVIVGMDVLRTGELVLRRDGSFSFTF